MLWWPLILEDQMVKESLIWLIKLWRSLIEVGVNFQFDPLLSPFYLNKFNFTNEIVSLREIVLNHKIRFRNFSSYPYLWVFLRRKKKKRKAKLLSWKRERKGLAFEFKNGYWKAKLQNWIEKDWKRTKLSHFVLLFCLFILPFFFLFLFVNFGCLFLYLQQTPSLIRIVLWSGLSHVKFFVGFLSC